MSIVNSATLYHELLQWFPFLTLFSSDADAPASSSFLTTSKWPPAADQSDFHRIFFSSFKPPRPFSPSVAMCRGVESVILFLEEITTFLSNFISSSITETDPLLAAMWAQVLPSCQGQKLDHFPSKKVNEPCKLCG